MSGSIYALLPNLASIMEIFTQLGSQYSSLLLNQLAQYRDLTDKQIGSMRLQAATIFVTAFLGGITGIASAFFPKGAVNPTLNFKVGDGFLKAVAEKLGDNDFMRTTLKTASKAMTYVGEGLKTLIQGSVTKDESNRSIFSQVHFQAAQEGQHSAQGVSDRANQFAISTIEKRGRGA